MPLNGNLDNQGLSDITVTNNGATVNNNGKIGKCYKCSGDSRISFPSFNWMTMKPQNNFSFFFWAKGTTTGWLFACSAWEFRLCPGYIQIHLAGNGQYPARYTDTFDTNTWYHLGFTWSGNNGKLLLYLNGSKVAESDVPSTANFDIASTFNIPYDGPRYLNDVRIYDHCLSPLEVKQISQGLVLHYPLSSISEVQKLNNDTTVYDCSGFSNNGAINGTINWSDDTPRYSGSYIPTTASSYISTTLNTSGYANSYTFSYWAKISDMSGKMVWGFGNGNRLNIYPTGTTFCWNTGDGGSNPFQNNGTNVSFSSYNGSWHHYVITGNGITTTLYIDGEKKGTASTYKAITGTQLYKSGWDTSTNYKWTGGNISDFRIYATCLSDEDIKDLYQVSASVDKTGILSCYEFSDNGNNEITKNGIISFSDLYESDDISSVGIGTDIIQANKFIEL